MWAYRNGQCDEQNVLQSIHAFFNIFCINTILTNTSSLFVISLSEIIKRIKKTAGIIISRLCWSRWLVLQLTWSTNIRDISVHVAEYSTDAHSLVEILCDTECNKAGLFELQEMAIFTD